MHSHSAVAVTLLLRLWLFPVWFPAVEHGGVSTNHQLFNKADSRLGLESYSYHGAFCLYFALISCCVFSARKRTDTKYRWKPWGAVPSSRSHGSSQTRKSQKRRRRILFLRRNCLCWWHIFNIYMGTDITLETNAFKRGISIPVHSVGASWQYYRKCTLSSCLGRGGCGKNTVLCRICKQLWSSCDCVPACLRLCIRLIRWLKPETLYKGCCVALSSAVTMKILAWVVSWSC